MVRRKGQQDLGGFFLEAEADGRAALPDLAKKLLAQLDAPPRLAAHLVLVHDVAAVIARWFEERWPNLDVDWEAVTFGAASHDIGKAIEPSELVRSGKRHEQAGREFLESMRIPDRLARYAETHGYQPDHPDLGLEDLLVILADKVWKGSRLPELEERIAGGVATRVGLEVWDVYVPLLDLLDEVAASADQRLAWQRLYPAGDGATERTVG